VNPIPQRLLEWSSELKWRLSVKHENDRRIKELEEILRIFAEEEK
jgi:hypothetical protein